MQDRYVELFNRQPQELSTVEKLLRMDCLACHEVADTLLLDKRVNHIFFYYMMVFIFEHLCVEVPELIQRLLDVDKELVQELIKFHAFRFKESVITASPVAEHGEYTSYYLELRSQFRKYVCQIVST